MHKSEYFVRALNSDIYRRRDWVISAFSIVRDREELSIENDMPYRLFMEDGEYRFVDPTRAGEHSLLEGTVPGQPAFRFKDELKLKAGDLANLKHDVKTTYGNALFNQLVLVYAFHDKIPYQEGEIKARAIEALIESRLTNEPEGGAPLPGEPGYIGGVKDRIYISEYKRFAEAIFSLAGFTQLCVPAATPKSMVAPPNLKEVKEELLERYKDRLHDPAVIAQIDKELVELDRKWLDGDASEGFFISRSSRDLKRKKMHLMYGAEMAFTDGSKATLVANSLAEGWDIDKMPELMNSLREGSYARGKLTALGGESVKYFMRVFQNTKVTMEDCGSKIGRVKKITQNNHMRYVGFYKINPSTLERLDEDNVKKYIDKEITLRSPMYCKAEGTGFCARCVGDVNSENPKALGAAVAAVGSEFMQTFMSAAHAKSLTTARWTLEELI